MISVAPIANSVYDGSGNLASTTQAKGSGKLFEKIKPTVSISAVNSSGVAVSTGSTTKDGSLFLSFDISEPSKGFTSDDITVSGGELTQFQSSSDVKFSATFTPSNHGATTVNINADVFTDTLGNTNKSSEVFSWFFDNTSPSISSVSLAADNSSIAGIFFRKRFQHRIWFRRSRSQRLCLKRKRGNGHARKRHANRNRSEWKQLYAKLLAYGNARWIGSDQRRTDSQ